LKQQIRQFALAEGAQLVAMASIGAYTEYLAEVETRLQETGARPEDFMISQVENMPGSRDTMFFANLADPRTTLPQAKTIIILGVYAYDEAAVYQNTRRDLRGKTARVYSYYPVVRRIAESVAKFIADCGGKAIHGQHVPLKFVADRVGLGTYGKNGILQTEQYGSYVALRDVLTNLELTPDHPGGGVKSL